MRTMKIAALTGVLVIALAACGNESPGSGGQGAGGGGQSQGGGEPAPGYGVGSPPVQTSGTITTGETGLGTILTDADGRTLYAFGADQNGKSTCYGDCAGTWPALTVDGKPEAADGLKASLLGTSERTDGTTQVTYGGLPLYYFASDDEPGDTYGQGVGDIWHVVSPSGDPIA